MARATTQVLLSDAESEAALVKQRQETEQAERKAFMLAAKDALAWLKERKVKTVTICYDGCGDSGQIGEIKYDDRQQKPVKVRSKRISGALEAFAFEVLYERHGGWENNDGADGEIIITIANGEYVCHHAENEARSTTSTENSWLIRHRSTVSAFYMWRFPSWEPPLSFHGSMKGAAYDQDFSERQ